MEVILKKEVLDDFPAVPYGCTVHGEEEIAAVVRVLRTSTQMGPEVRALEASIAALFAKQHGIMVNSGSSALALAIEILDLPAGSEVITPVLTFATAVAPLVKNNLLPVFVDVEADTFNIDASKIAALITPNTRALLIPNLLGNLPDWKKIHALAQQHKLVIIEDSADTLSGTCDEKLSGNFSDISITSFYGSHVINCAGNGGMLCVNDDAMASRARLLRSWGRTSSLFVESEAIENRFNVSIDGIPYDAKFVFADIGYNLEPSEMGAAFGRVQLGKLEKNIRLREEFFQQHVEFFSQYSQWLMMPRQLPDVRTGWLAFAMIVRDDAPFTRTELQIFFERRRIQTRTVFTGNILRQPGFAGIKHKAAPEGYPQADQVMRGGILLGCHQGLNPAQMRHIHDSFKFFAEQFS
jgi:CDP-6-deoxy-D-xylo-4-hexulose-3-dehydrase